MNKSNLNLITVWKSKLAVGLIPLFVAVVALPLAVTILVVAKICQQELFTTAQTTERYNVGTIREAGWKFQRLGETALHQSNLKIAMVCLSASRSASEQAQKDQTALLASSGKDFGEVTQDSFNDATRQSLAYNKQILGSIASQMNQLFASAAHYTQNQVGDQVQSAILEQINAQMSERAGQLAQSFTSYIQTNVNYLELTAQMLNLHDGDVPAEKAVLDAVVRRFPMMSQLCLVNMNGREIVMSDSDKVVLPSELVDQSFEPYFKTAIQDEIYVGVDSFPVDGDAPVLRLSVPVELYRGKAVGVLTAGLSLSDLWDVIRDTQFGRSGFAYVADRNGFPFLPPHHCDGAVLEQFAVVAPLGWRLVVCQPQSDVMLPIQSFKSDISNNTRLSLTQMHADMSVASSLASAKLLSESIELHKSATQMLQQRTDEILRRLGITTASKSLVQRQLLMAAIRNEISSGQMKNDAEMIQAARFGSSELETRMPLVTCQALDRAYKHLRFCGTVIFIASCIMSCLIGFLLAAALVKPILQLCQGTRWLANGHLNSRVDENAPAELGDLATAFNILAASLQQSRADLNEAESHLVQSAKLASLGTLSAGVAHELNQPVAIVRGLAQQLKNNRELTPELREDLEIIEGQTGRMMKIITHLRTFCRVGSREMVSVDINQVVRDCFILINAQLSSHGIDIDLDLCKESPRVSGDANELEQVFINLITNARDAMSSVGNARLTITSRVANGHMSLEFRDTGPGVPDAITEHIFDPFFTTKEVGKGTGLGLSISHGIIQRHGGSIAVKNDGGAVFSIILPVDLTDDSVDGRTYSNQSRKFAA